MLTIVTTPRPLYSGKFEMDFDNAIGSWLRLEPRPQILVFGGDESIVARDGVTHVSQFPQSEQGLPYLDGCLEITQKLAEYDLVMLTSDHLILLSDFTRALERLAERFPDGFAATGQRWDRLVDLPIDFDEDWETKIVQGNGRPRGIGAKDFIVFSTPLQFEIRDFVLGRQRWDTWFLHQLCISGLSVVDISCVVTPIHPIHCYDHVPLGEDATTGTSTDPGTLHNVAIQSSTPYPHTIGHLSWGLTRDRLLSGDDWKDWKEAHEQAWHYKRIRHEFWGTLRRPAYCWDPPAGVGRKI